MKLTQAQTMARELMSEHGVARDWKFSFDNAKKRFGRCSHQKRTIQLSAPITLLNDEAAVKDTILHEVAHALAGPGQGHNSVWKACCRQVGANPERCYDTADVVSPASPWKYQCPKCGVEAPVYRRPKQNARTAYACRPCWKSRRVKIKLDLISNA